MDEGGSFVWDTKIGMASHVDGLGAMSRVYNHMGQPKRDPFINCVVLKVYNKFI